MSNRNERKTGFADFLIESRRRSTNVLDKINDLIDWRPIEKRLNKDLKRKPCSQGNVPYPALNMFKSLLLQCWHNLSDQDTEDALADRISFSRFAGFSLDHEVPDASTICRFRNHIDKSWPDLLEILYRAKVVGEVRHNSRCEHSIQ